MSSRGSPDPPSSAVISGFVRFRRSGSCPPVISRARRSAPRPAAGPGNGQGPGRRGTPPGDLHDDAARAAQYVAAADLAQVRADQPGGLRVRRRQEAVDIRRPGPENFLTPQTAIGRLGAAMTDGVGCSAVSGGCRAAQTGRKKPVMRLPARCGVPPLAHDVLGDRGRLAFFGVDCPRGARRAGLSPPSTPPMSP